MGENKNLEFNNFLPPKSSDRTLISFNEDNEKNEYQEICLINLKNSEKNLIDNDKKEDNKKNLIEKEVVKLICQKCGAANKNYYKCFDCELILCQKCKEESRHDKLIEYELFNIIVLSQLQNSPSYFENGGTKYESNSINIPEDLKSNINLGELEKKISKNKKIINDIIDKLNKIKENLDFYYEVNCIINDNLNKNNYEIIKTKDKIKTVKKEIISEIKDIINKNKLEEILNNLKKICDFKIPSKSNSTNCFKLNLNNKTRNKSNSPTNNNSSEKPILIEDISQNIEKKEEILMKLKFEKNNNLEYLRIFGDKFVENNKQCKMFIENKDYGIIVYGNSNSTQNFEELYPYVDINSKIELKGKDLDKDIIIHLKSSNTITNLSDMFCNCINLLSFEAISSDNNLNITNMSNMFYNCTSLKLINISGWNISKVIDINGIFSNCKKLDLESLMPKFSNWDTSNVIDMSYAFSNCESLKSLSIISNWNTSKVEKMNGMFKDCIQLESIPDDLEWNTSNVNNMNFMFCNCKNLKDITHISKLDFSKVSDMNNIFAECSSLKNISEFSIEKALNVTDISYMFFDCTELDTLPKKFEFNENIITDISYMFYKTKLKTEDIKSAFLDNNRYPKAYKTEILEGLNKNVNCLII